MTAPLILAVDDEDLVLRFLDLVLSRAGYRVKTAASGSEALNMCDRELLNPQLALLDVVMPGLSGPALLQDLRRRYKDIPCVFISGYTVDQIGLALEHPLDPASVLQKPFTAQILLDRVRDALATNSSSAC